MEHIYLAGAAAGIILSWVYILCLKAKIRECLGYIETRIDLANPGLSDRGRRCAGDESNGEAGSSLRDRNDIVLAPQGGAAVADKPKLIVANSGINQPFHYLCSLCLWPFLLPGDQPPKAAVAELFHTFREHIEQEHPNPSQVWGAGSEG